MTINELFVKVGNGDATVGRLYLTSLAILHGVQDKSYKTVRYGRIAMFRGEAVFEVDGIKVKAIGYEPEGDAQVVTKNGGIKFEIMEVK